MGVDLSNLNISLDQFNAVSSGKYNIGQLKLGADGAKLVNELFRFVATINSAIMAQDEKDAIYGSEDYTAFVTTSTDLLFTLNPGIVDGVRNLDADAMAKVETVEEVTLDITGDNPRVIGVRLGQKVAP